MNAQTAARVVAFLDAHHVASLATCGGPGPHAANVFYVREEFALLWVSDPGSRHSVDLGAEPRIAATVAPDCFDMDDVRGVQLSGNATSSPASHNAYAHDYCSKPVTHASNGCRKAPRARSNATRIWSSTDWKRRALCSSTTVEALATRKHWSWRNLMLTSTARKKTDKSAAFDTTAQTSGKVAGSNIVPCLPYDDLRQWLDEARELGEVKDVPGLSWQQDIGMVSELALHDDTAACFVFNEVPGTIQGSRVLVNFFGGKRKNMTLGFSTDLAKIELSEAFRASFMAPMTRIL